MIPYRALIESPWHCKMADNLILKQNNLHCYAIEDDLH